MKRIVSVLLLLGLVACAREYELVDSSEYYFYPEEYEERYANNAFDFSINKKKASSLNQGSRLNI